MSTTNLKVRSANRVVIKFDGKKIGLLSSLRMSDDYAPEPASGIGDIHVAENVPTMARHTINVASAILFTESMREVGITAIDGDAVLDGQVFDIVVESKDDGAELRKYTGCSYASGDVDITKHAIIVANAVFMALDVSGSGV